MNEWNVTKQANQWKFQLPALCSCSAWFAIDFVLKLDHIAYFFGLSLNLFLAKLEFSGYQISATARCLACHSSLSDLELES